MPLCLSFDGLYRLMCKRAIILCRADKLLFSYSVQNLKITFMGIFSENNNYINRKIGLL